MSAGLDRITIDPEQMNGQPCILGMRLTVRRVLEAAALCPDRIELKRDYPEAICSIPSCRRGILQSKRRSTGLGLGLYVFSEIAEAKKRGPCLLPLEPA